MENAGWYSALKAIGFVVIALMLVSIVYAGYMSVAYWPGIGV